MSESKPREKLTSDMNSYMDLQRRRVALDGLGPQLERFATRLNGSSRHVAFIAAAQAYQFTSDEENELRLLASVSPNLLGAANQKPLFSLLLIPRPEILLQIAPS